MIESGYFWQNTLILAAGTLLIRASIIFLSARVKISDRIKELFSYIPAAILPAFVAPAVFLHEGHVAWAYGKERLVILVLAVLVCMYTKSTLATIAFGLTALYLVSQVLG